MFCCAVCDGSEGPLPMVTESPLESTSVIVSLSLFATNQPAGMVTDRLEFDTLPLPLVGEPLAIGLGVVAGVGLGKPDPRPDELVWLAFLELTIASAVPQAPMTRTRPTTALMRSTHGVR